MASTIGMVLLMMIMVSLTSLASALSVNYYEHTCPQVESIVAGAVHKATMNDKTVPSALLRMHFHDCFVRGKNKAEKDGPPNISLHAFYVIDNAKKALEAVCPGVVSCADILALAARDAVTLSGGPNWEVPKGRKDGIISKATETRQLPAPTFNISQLQQSFSQRGLSLQDLVALSGGHTLGFAHCSSFQNRIHKFSPKQAVDPSLNPSFASNLQSKCHIKNKVKNSGSPLDSTATYFDNAYYKLLLQGKSILSSDQALLTHPTTKALVSKYAHSQMEFERAFVKSMIKMSSITNGGKQIRLQCNLVR
ncbi:peroxidase 64 isoform X2 [Medicago truncatula]|uniref:peroxidase 64 isoform X2 n=1 Tax=Medicago truncatula TaxID=3880 RepID=UPI0019681BE8|nr:peroxidase 64 isoform X2 [Medicago truncatula]